MINKPITVARQIFIENVVNEINESGLPFFVVADVLSSFIPELRKQATVQFEEDRKAYEESLTEHDNDE